MKTIIRFSLAIWVSWGMLWAQNDMISNVNMQLRFANPGARALAMGGAFVGLADDHTSIFADLHPKVHQNRKRGRPYRRQIYAECQGKPRLCC